jgi:glycosyltransferase involved in cell wall biosynthesis
MSGLPLVSIVIIFFNAEEFLQEAIESVCAQTYRNWELLLIDDGSTDRSAQIARRYVAEYPACIHYLEHPGRQNRGMSASRNLGIRQARGDWVAFLDADDVWLPDKLERQVSVLKVRPEIGMLYGNTLYWHSWSEASAALSMDYIPRIGLPTDTIIQPPGLLPLFLSGKAAVPCICSILVKKEVLDRVGGFEESFRSLYEDQVIYVKICLNEPVFISEGCWEKYRQYPDSVRSSTSNNHQAHAARALFLNWLENYIGERRISNPQIWQALRQEQWRIQHPFWARIERSALRLEKRMKGEFT